MEKRQLLETGAGVFLWGRARRYTQLLADASGAAEDTATQMNELNPRYNVNVSPYPLLTQTLHANCGQAVLVDHLAQGMPGEELVLFNQVSDGNNGQERPTNPLFGELVVGTPIVAVPLGALALTPEEVDVDVTGWKK